MPVDKFGRISNAKTRDTGVSLTYINNNYVRSDGSTPVSGSIVMKGNTLHNVSNPVNPLDVATKEYTDKVGWGETAIVKTQYGNYGTLRNIDMRGYTLTNVLDPADAQDVATKEYVDVKNAYITRELGHVKNTIYKRPQIIAVHASYHGPLIRGKYQFTFGGNESYSPLTGFLLPQSGRIKKKN